MLTGLELNKRLEHVKPAPEQLGRLGHNASALHAPAVLFPTICRLMELARQMQGGKSGFWFLQTCFSANIFVTQMLTDRTKQIFQTQMLTDCMSNVVYRNMNHGRGKFRLIQNWSRNFLSLPWLVPHPFGAPIPECGNLCKSDHSPL